MSSLCGTDVFYGDIEIRNVLTESVDCETAYDSTNVDPIGVRTRMVFTGEIHSTVGDYDFGVAWQQPSGQLAGGVYDTIQEFERPRQILHATIGGTTLFYVRPGGTAACAEPTSGSPVGGTPTKYDVSNGPRTTCTILAVKGTRSAKCRFTVEFTTALRCGDNADTEIGHILNLRWVVLDDIDCKSWLTRRVYQGRIRFRSRDVNLNPHNVARLYVFPPLVDGFRRESVSYHEETNALEMTFQIVDQETGFAAPAPATSWEGTYSMVFPQHGIAMEQELNLVLRADKLAGLPTEQKGYRVKQHLTTLATYIIEQKMHWEMNRTGGNRPGNFFLQSANFTENLAENEIRVSVRAIIHSADAWAVNMRTFRSSTALSLQDIPFGLPLPTQTSAYPNNPRYRYYNYQQTTIPPSYSGPTSSILCVLQNPCCPAEINSPGLFDQATHIAQETSSPDPGGTAIVTYQNQAQYSDSHNSTMYQFYRMSSSLEEDTGWRAFPLGKQCVASGSDATVAFAHLHCPVQVRKVTIHGTRVNAWPELLRPVHWTDAVTGIKHVLAKYKIEPLPVQLSADGRDTLHEVLATYWYYLDRPFEVTSAYKIPVGRLPYVAPNGLKIGIVTAGGQDANGQAIDQQFFLDPGDLLGMTP